MKQLTRRDVILSKLAQQESGLIHRTLSSVDDRLVAATSLPIVFSEDEFTGNRVVRETIISRLRTAGWNVILGEDGKYFVQ